MDSTIFYVSIIDTWKSKSLFHNETNASHEEDDQLLLVVLR